MKNIIIIIIIAVLFGSCKKYLDVGSPATQLSSKTVFQNDATATAAQLAVYAQLEAQGMLYRQILLPGLSSDEFKNHSSIVSQIDIATNNLTADNTTINTLWSSYYGIIYQENAVLEGIAASPSLSNEVRRQLEGEARIVRAWCYFYLVNLFGDVPLAVTTDYAVNAVLVRTSVQEIYTLMVNDLTTAVPLLDAGYKNAANASSAERVRPNRAAAHALLARVQLYRSKWVEAEAAATEVIGNSSLYELLTDMNAVFLKNSREAIWQIQPVVQGFNTYAGGFIVFSGTPTSFSLSPLFVASFRPGDNRKDAWTKMRTNSSGTYWHSYKYKIGQGSAPVTEYSMVLRMSEQFLIRAEARARQDNLSGAEADLNAVRSRAGLNPIIGIPKNDLLDSIQIERKFELFSESAERWFNLKRTGMTLQTLIPVKGASFTATDELYPIPQNELNRNPRLSQNPGY